MSPFCDSCGNLVVPKRIGEEQRLIYWCTTCQREVSSEIEDTTFFQERTPIEHSPKEITRVLEGGPPPIPQIFTQSYEQRRKGKKCRHPNAVFQGFYQFSKGDEASRKYWFCPDCGHVFRFSGKVDIKPRRKLVHDANPDQDPGNKG
jgi:DNA-directed RNA polymerase subunit M/transcription elongation factor TFIIS